VVKYVTVKSYLIKVQVYVLLSKMLLRERQTNRLETYTYLSWWRHY